MDKDSYYDESEPYKAPEEPTEPCTEYKHDEKTKYRCCWCRKLACFKCSSHKGINEDITKTGRICDLCREDDEDVSRD